jgi:hypothetical protein
MLMVCAWVVVQLRVGDGALDDAQSMALVGGKERRHARD